MLQIVFFAQKTPDFGKKKKYVMDLGGTPSPPLRTKFSAERGLRIWAVHPPPFTDKIRQEVIDPFAMLTTFQESRWLGKSSRWEY